MRKAFVLAAFTFIAAPAAHGQETSCADALSRLQTEHQTLRATNARLEQELAVLRHGGDNIVRLTEERSTLHRELAALTRRAAELEQQNLDLLNEDRQRWFLIGAAVLAGGLLLGLIVPELKLRRRKSPWSRL